MMHRRGRAPVSSQLPLGVQLRDDATLDNFLFLPGSEILSPILESLAGDESGPVVFLVGSEGSGRSHLLQGACHGAAAGSAQYLPLAQLAELGACQVLADMEGLDLVCLDDVDAVAGDPRWEEALFHFYNRCLESTCSMLFSAAAAPAALDVELPDLRSRLGAGTVYQLPSAGDSQKQRILEFRALQRGMPLTGELATYIMARSGRSLSGLMKVLDQLDRDSLVEKRQLTIPFVKQSMGW